MGRNRLLGLATVGAALIVALGLLTLQAGQAALDETVIEQVIIDRDAGTLTILGTGFDQKTDTTVTLGGTVLSIASETTAEIVATLPSSIVAGNYLLRVDIAQGKGRADEFDLAIAAPAALSAISTFPLAGCCAPPVQAISDGHGTGGGPIPDMALDVVVPPGENRVALVTLNMMASCQQALSTGSELSGGCAVSGSLAGVTGLDRFAPASTSLDYGAYSWQWVTQPLSPGTHRLTMFFLAYDDGTGNQVTFSVSERTLTVVTFPVSNTDVDIVEYD